MISPLHGGRSLEIIESVPSTQDAMREHVLHGDSVGAVLALEQTAGRGRQGREWLSPRGECLALSLAFWGYARFDTPQYFAMAVAIAAARALDTKLRWPNDLVLETKDGVRKVGGVLGEIVGPDRIPVIGIGVNLLQRAFPLPLEHVATSLVMAGRRELQPEDAAMQILDTIPETPEPSSWQNLAGFWQDRDLSKGKHYRLPDERLAIAERVGDDGRLVARVGEELIEISVADAL
jgi:BirA family biotin operon repressor/biotin-[acetyl-CoA-carboxylase] ligase